MDDAAFILESRGNILLQLLSQTFDSQLAEHPRLTALREACKPVMTVSKGIAHVPISGVLAYNPDPFEMAVGGFEDSRNVLDMIDRARTDQAVKGIQLNIDSPGGFMTGGFEIADAVAAANKIKPVIAHVGGTGASLAYLIASQAGEVVANRTARVGSIGAFAVNIDTSQMFNNSGLKVEVFKNKEAKFKAMGTPGTSLTEDQRAHLLAQTQANFDEFKSMVLSARPKIPSEAMQGQVFTGKQAKANALVDRIGDHTFASFVLRDKSKA